MRLLSRRHTQPPAGVRDLLPGKEVVVAWVPLSEDGWVVAGPSYLTVAVTGGQVLRASWDDVEHAAWEADSRTFTIHLVAGVSPLRLTVDAGAATKEVDALARALRQRVEASVVHSVTRTLPDGTRVGVSVRRGPDGSLYTRTSPQDVSGLSPADRELLETLLRDARDGVGLPTA